MKNNTQEVGSPDCDGVLGSNYWHMLGNHWTRPQIILPPGYDTFNMLPVFPAEPLQKHATCFTPPWPVRGRWRLRLLPILITWDLESCLSKFYGSIRTYDHPIGRVSNIYTYFFQLTNYSIECHDRAVIESDWVWIITTRRAVTFITRIKTCQCDC